MALAPYAVDPDDPRAPSAEVWEALTPQQRREVVDSLPSEPRRASPPEGDLHRMSKNRALAVADVEPHERARWVVSDEGRGLDLVLEIHVAGDAAKDFRDNVERYAQLGIPEYFAFDVGGCRLAGWRLAEHDRYSPIVPQHGRWSSGVLGLDLAVEDGRLRFYHGTAELLDGRELIARLSRMVDGAVKRAEDEARRAEEEARRAEDEARRAERLADRLRSLGIDPDSV